MRKYTGTMPVKICFACFAGNLPREDGIASEIKHPALQSQTEIPCHGMRKSLCGALFILWGENRRGGRREYETITIGGECMKQFVRAGAAGGKIPIAEFFAQRPDEKPNRARVALPNRQTWPGKFGLILRHGQQAYTHGVQQGIEIIPESLPDAIRKTLAPCHCRLFLLHADLHALRHQLSN